MARGVPGLAAAWVLSCAPLVLPALSPDLGLALGESSRAALAALPWIAWLGAPAAKGAGRRSGSLPTAALALPPIAAGIGLDLELGADTRALAVLAGGALAMIVALAFAAEIAARDPRRARWHAVAWLALVPGAPLLALCLGLGGAPTYGEPPRWLSAIARAGPLGWIAARARSEAAGGPALAGALVALGVCLVLLAVARGSGREAPR